MKQTCLRCDKSWHSRTKNPVQCPRCKSPVWNKPKHANRKPDYVCQCCAKLTIERDHEEFTHELVSAEAQVQYGLLCWNCLIFSHPELLGTKAPSILHKCELAVRSA